MSLVKLEASDAVVEAILDIWRETGKVSEMVVYGRSMEPAIPKGSRVRVQHTVEGVRIGSIIVFKNGDHLTAHRVVEILEKGSGERRFVTQGDWTGLRDGEIEERCVVGRVTAVLGAPRGGIPEEEEC